VIDSHCHLADDAFEADVEAVIGRARDAGVERALCIVSAGDEPEARRAARIREMWPGVRLSVGVHPHNAGQFDLTVAEAGDRVRRAVPALAARAVGEIGLDYHYDFAPRDVQREVFAVQLTVARELRLPVVIHTREASEDTFDVLRSTAQGAVVGVFHCFTGDWQTARRALDIGFFISLSGIVTFPRAVELRDVARRTPDDRLLVETDAPYLAPVPHRGQRNEPAYVTRVVEVVADARGVAAPELAAMVTRNFEAFLGPTVSL
jgi:TatD DNase family protein